MHITSGAKNSEHSENILISLCDQPSKNLNPQSKVVVEGYNYYKEINPRKQVWKADF